MYTLGESNIIERRQIRRDTIVVVVVVRSMIMCYVKKNGTSLRNPLNQLYILSPINVHRFRNIHGSKKTKTIYFVVEPRSCAARPLFCIDRECSYQRQRLGLTETVRLTVRRGSTQSLGLANERVSSSGVIGWWDYATERDENICGTC